ncbi:MAG: hypothetical protein GAK28_04404 [Luteibacter sp.]|nr:MAG: hypothetical protein GAK28_04404 [Luteibacter sp.]
MMGEREASGQATRRLAPPSTKAMPRSGLSDSERAFLKRLRDEFTTNDGWAICSTNPPSAAIQGLVDRGYCKLAQALCGPLAVPTGEVMVSLTEAGRLALLGQS